MPMKRTRMDRKTPWTSSKAMMTKEPSMNARRQRIVVVVALAVIAGMALLAIAHIGPIRPSDRAADNRGIIGPTRPQSQVPAPLPEIIPSPKLAVERDAALPGPAPDGMVWIPGGTFWMGADDTSMADATPVHEVTVSGFWMDRTEVTNRQFASFVWGNELRPGGKCQANIWEGHFPDENSSDDGFARTAPVATFPPNDFGLHDIAGNVWEWCSDWYRPNYDNLAQRDPTGPPSSYDPSEPGVFKRVQRGGSFLCSDQYCTRYLPGARGKGAPDSAASHVGFRCVLSAKRAD
jgi:hypothetical protein